ncbi:hypothetical protein NEPAR04_2498 [Nematocida parisii]|nr:hypothetical protein NEPAR08_2455 [Nematocida parisii]KAI5131505.1 hypothetical protein NEPAR03_2459 [Nematocida parisii]KAI5145635.1 hypothetical protein NEPAR04_2498 [Nematocida parisii]
MQKDWCKVVADLKNKKIVYEKKGNNEEKTNELDSSLLNILYVVPDITGNKEKVLDEIEKIEIMCSNKEPGTLLNVQKSLTEIFTALSNNNSLEVKCESFKVGNREEKRPGLFGNFSIVYRFGEIEAGISLDIKDEHTKLDITRNSLSKQYKEAIKPKLTEIKSIYKIPKGYTECVIRNYMDIKRDAMRSIQSYQLKKLKKTILDIISAGSSDAFRLFLYGNIESTVCKECIVITFLFFYIANPQNENSLSRMTNNVIGSVPLDDLIIEKKILYGFICNKDARNYYRNIEAGIWVDVFTDKCCAYTSFYESFYDSLSLYFSGMRFDLITCINRLMKIISGAKNAYASIIKNNYLFASIILRGFKETENPRIIVFKQIMGSVKELCKEMDEKQVTGIYISWIWAVCFNMAAIKHETRNLDQLLVYLFNVIEDSKYITLTKEKRYKSDSEEADKVLECLESRRKQICSNGENTQKYNKIIQIFKNEKSRS